MITLSSRSLTVFTALDSSSENTLGIYTNWDPFETMSITVELFGASLFPAGD